MPKKFTDKQILGLVKEHADGASISALARKYKVSRDTIRCYLQEKSEFRQEYVTSKNETVTEWLKDHKKEITDILSQIIKDLPTKLKNASVKDLMGAYKILSETSINNVESKQSGMGADEPSEIKVVIVDNAEHNDG